jgi:hypothetical protein
MRLCSGGIAILCVLWVSAGDTRGAVVEFSSTEIIDNWYRHPEPITETTNYWQWHDRTTYVQFGVTTEGGLLVHPDPVAGDFSFHVQIKGPRDGYLGGGRLGVAFGYQDGDNNYRLSWERENVNAPENDGSRGLSLIREVDGVSTSLFNQEIFWEYPSIKWEPDIRYDITVSRAADSLSFVIARWLNGADDGQVASATVSDSTFMWGYVGFWNQREMASYRDVTLDSRSPNVVPEPVSFIVWTIFGVILVRVGCSRARRICRSE